MNGSTSAVEARQVAGTEGLPPPQLATLYAPIVDDLRAVEAMLQRELSSEYEFINSLVGHALRLGGKRLRPALLLLSARACGDVGDGHLLLAAVVEMIHTATLVHDDVLDEADLRRHRPTVNARFDNEASVLLGDYLFSHAFYLASTLDSTFACRLIGRSTNIVCQGELRQIENRGNLALSEEQYLQIIGAKTAELCACCCRLGARHAGADAHVETALEQFGRDLGVAFQITDDLLDLLGDEAEMGKSLGTDVAQCKPTLPLIHLLADADDNLREEIAALFKRPPAECLAALVPRLTDAGAFDYARGRAAEYARRAVAALQPVAEGEARDVLEQLPNFVLSRRR